MGVRKQRLWRVSAGALALSGSCRVVATICAQQQGLSGRLLACARPGWSTTAALLLMGAAAVAYSPLTPGLPCACVHLSTQDQPRQIDSLHTARVPAAATAAAGIARRH
jgi:hypothetical protein